MAGPGTVPESGAAEEPAGRSGGKTATRTICVSLPVRHLQVSRACYAELGFTFSPELSDQTACMIVDRNICVMLVAEERFRDSVAGEIRQATAA